MAGVDTDHRDFRDIDPGDPGDIRLVKKLAWMRRINREAVAFVII